VSHNRYPATFGSSFIYRAAQGGIIHEKNVCLSVRPSVGVNCDKTKDTSAHITYHMKERLGTVHYSDKRCSDTRYSDKRWYFNN